MSLIPELGDSCTLTAVKPVTITGFTILSTDEGEAERERGGGIEGNRERETENNSDPVCYNNDTAAALYCNTALTCVSFCRASH